MQSESYPICNECLAKGWQELSAKKPADVKMSDFITQLMNDSEQLKTLTEDSLEVLKAKKQAEIMRVAMKEAAGIISHSLRNVNRASA